MGCVPSQQKRSYNSIKRQCKAEYPKLTDQQIINKREQLKYQLHESNGHPPCLIQKNTDIVII